MKAPEAISKQNRIETRGTDESTALSWVVIALILAFVPILITSYSDLPDQKVTPPSQASTLISQGKTLNVNKTSLSNSESSKSSL